MSRCPFFEQNRPMCAGQDLNPGDLLELSGWGVQSEGGQLSDTLKLIQLPYVADATCAYRYGSVNYISEVMICAGGLGGADLCQGDTGSPLTFNQIHVGIASWAYGCARPFYPSVYTQTDAILDWINENIQ